MITKLSSFIGRLSFTATGAARKVQRHGLMGSTIRYLLKVDTAAAFERAVRACTDLDYEQAREVRKNIVGSSYVVQQLKAWALLHIFQPPASMGVAQGRAERYGIAPIDCEVLTPVIQELWDEGLLDATYDLLWASPGARVALHPEQAALALGSIYPDLYKHTKRLVYRKMRFIMHSQNEEVEDLVSRLIVQAVGRFWWLLPTSKSVLHITNSLRAAVNGLAVNEIQWYTAKCRSRLNADGVGGFSLQTVSQNQIGAEIQYHELADQESLAVNPTAKSDDRMMVLQLHKHVSSGPRPRAHLKMLMLLTGAYDRKFSAYLKDLELPDNDEYYDAVDLDSYLRHAAAFTGINRPQSFLTDLRRLFG